jgi:hypothetical protein
VSYPTLCSWTCNKCSDIDGSRQLVCRRCLVQRAGDSRGAAWSQPNGGSLNVLTFYSEGSKRTAYAAHCNQRGLAPPLVSSKVCCCALGHPPALRRGPSF